MFLIENEFSANPMNTDVFIRLTPDENITYNIITVENAPFIFAASNPLSSDSVGEPSTSQVLEPVPSTSKVEDSTSESDDSEIQLPKRRKIAGRAFSEVPTA